MTNLSRFFTTVRPLFANGLSPDQVDGMTAILTGWDAWMPGNPDLNPNIRWLAYALATTFHETGERMVPVREIGEGRGRRYGVKQANGQTYYGRGYVQLTWPDNYETFGAQMGIPLYDNPDLALEPKWALAIMLNGMAAGHFTGKRFGQYFGANPLRDDPVNARRIINGLDQATEIARYHKVFLAGLDAPAIQGTLHAGSNVPHPAAREPVAVHAESVSRKPFVAPAASTVDALNAAELTATEGE